MKIQNNYNLSKLNTFGILAQAKFFVEINTEDDLKELFDMEEFSARGGSAYGGKNIPKLFLGGGSNILFTKDFDGLVILNKLKGIEILKAPTPKVVVVPTTSVGKDFVYIRSMGGEMWHNLVVFSVERNLWGIENLAFVPGTVGAAPIQNIGAYGVELKDVFHSAEGIFISDSTRQTFLADDCEFDYRNSIFKKMLKE